MLVEGFWSVFRLHALGMPAVALMGIELSREQEELLAASAVKRVVLLLDGDGPGRKAAAELLPRLARWFFVRAAELPGGGQPDSVSEEVLQVCLPLPCQPELCGRVVPAGRV